MFEEFVIKNKVNVTFSTKQLYVNLNNKVNILNFIVFYKVIIIKFLTIFFVTIIIISLVIIVL